MKVTLQLDDAQWAAAFRRLMELTGKEATQLLREWAGLLCLYAMKLTPPFGDEPIREKWAKQHQVGLKRVANDVRNAFSDPRKLDMWEGELGKAIEERMQAGDFATATNLLRDRGNVRTQGVIPGATRGLHHSARDKRGRVRWTKRTFHTVNDASVSALTSTAQALVGAAKSGWMVALTRLNKFRARKIGTPKWIKGGRGKTSGYYFEGGSQDRPTIEFGNLVPHAQKHRAHIESRAWRQVMRNLPLQVRAMERAIEKKLKRSMATSVGPGAAFQQAATKGLTTGLQTGIG